jgi:hypothetical protein
MTKETYYQKINALDFECVNFKMYGEGAWPTGTRACSMTDAGMIAEDADQEIAKLKELLKDALFELETTFVYPEDLANLIHEVLNDK